MMKFNVGDKVAIYDIDRSVGVIEAVDHDDNTVMIKNEWYHVKQCRKLINKNVNDHFDDDYSKDKDKEIMTRFDIHQAQITYLKGENEKNSYLIGEILKILSK